MECSEILNKKTELELKLEDIEDEIFDLEEDKDNVLIEIAHLGKLFMDKVEKIDKFIGDPFTDDFIRASMFCERIDNNRPFLQTVLIKENALVALNGYMLIEIHNSNIPNDLQNKLIMWDVRKDFNKNISELKVEDYINYDSVIPKEGFKHIIENVTAESFNSLLKVEEIDGSYTSCKIVYKDFIIYARKEFLETIFKALGNEIFTVKFIGPVEPIIFQNGHMLVLILPIRMSDEFYSERS